MAMVKIKQIVGLTDNLNTLDSSINSLESVVSQGTGNLEASVNSLEGNVSSINTRAGLIEGVNTAQDASINSLEGIASTAISTNNAQDASINSLEGLTSSIDTYIYYSIVSDRLNPIENDITTLEGNVSSINTRAGLIEGVNTAQDASINSLEGIASTAISTNNAQDASINSLEGLTSSIDTYIYYNIVSDRLDPLDESVNSLEGNVSTIQSSFAENPTTLTHVGTDFEETVFPGAIKYGTIPGSFPLISGEYGYSILTAVGSNVFNMDNVYYIAINGLTVDQTKIDPSPSAGYIGFKLGFQLDAGDLVTIKYTKDA